jgi:hypothetical protein
MGFRYYFQYTVMANPRQIDPKSPPVESAVATFRELAQRIGPERLIWRYDPIVLSELTTPDFHVAAHRQIAEALASCTQRNVISIVDPYRKAQARLRSLRAHGITVKDVSPQTADDELGATLEQLAATAKGVGMEIFSCAEELNLQPYGIMPGKCIDDEYIFRTFGLCVAGKKDPSQRSACGCIVGKDIGVYDTCLFGCAYCYATSSFDRARRNHEAHDPASPSLAR